MKPDHLIECVLRAHEVLGRESDLSPRNPRINEALAALVRGIMEGCPAGGTARVLADPRVRAMRGALVQRLALAETAMERQWAEALCRRVRLTAADFRAFPYWDCYRHLVWAELRSLGPHLRLAKGESVAFVGAGPLPLSAIMIEARAGLRVTGIDLDPGACGLARELCRRAALAGLEFTCASGAHYDYACHPVVLVASLVPGKAQVMQRVRTTRPSALVALRSVEGLSTLLYDPVDETELEAAGYGYLGRTRPNRRAINTTLLYETAPALRKVSGGGARDGCPPGAMLGLALLKLRSRARRGGPNPRTSPAGRIRPGE